MTHTKEAQAKNSELVRNNFFINSVSKKFVVNSVISMVFLYAGSLVDTLIVGMYLGEKGLAAMSLVSPVYLVYYTVGATVGIGASVVSSRVLGKNDKNTYAKIFSVAFYILLAFTSLMTVFGYAFLNPISVLLCGGNDSASLPLVKEYLGYYIPGGAFTLIAYIPLYFLKTEGRPKISSRLFSASAVINVVLSWFYMSPICGMGIGGASLATSISMGSVAAIGFVYLMCVSDDVKFVRKCFDRKLIKEILVAGIPNGLSNLLESAQILLVNMLLISVGAEFFLPCYTVTRNVMGILNSVIVGISSALIPLVGVFFGERDYASERSVIKLSRKVGLISVIPLIVVVSLLAGPLSRLFGVTDAAIIRESYFAIPLACIGLAADYLNSLYTSYLTAINREWLATVMVALRTFVIQAVVGIPMSRILGSKGIWLSFSVAYFAALLVFYAVRAVIRKKKPSLDAYLLDTELEREEDISFSVKNDVEDIVSASESCSIYCEEHDVDMKRCMRVSLAIEELLTFLIGNCFKDEQQRYIDVRMCKIDDEVMLRFRYIGEIFDPLNFYEVNSDNEDMQEALLGLKMIFNSANLAYFKQTLGVNNLVVIF